MSGIMNVERAAEDRPVRRSPPVSVGRAAGEILPRSAVRQLKAMAPAGQEAGKEVAFSAVLPSQIILLVFAAGMQVAAIWSFRAQAVNDLEGWLYLTASILAAILAGVIANYFKR